VADPDKFTILLADDSPVYRKMLEQSLAQENCALLLAKNGRDAIDLFAKHRPALVITDWTMPDISGIELCQRIRRDFELCFAYLILVTSHSEKEQVIQGLAAGADDYLTKPFHPGELLARVRVGRRMIELNRQTQAQNRQLEEMALTDALTGLPNRRAIELWAAPQLSAAARHNFWIWVVMADLDHFKRVNDTYGHEAGDTVLKGFAEIVKSNTRSSNICGRLGGEEFLLILTHGEREEIVIPIERIRKQFETLRFTFCDRPFHATASFGIAGFCGTASPDLKRLIASADAALYSAKQKGRNRIELAPLV
jgi:two-component system, cell cycle response regulator